MKNPNDNFLQGRIRSFKFALRGIGLLILTEPSIKVQFGVAVIMTIAGFVLDISTVEWMFQFVVIGMVLTAESLNTSIEKLADFVHPDYHKQIGFIKDVSAGAVAFTSVIAVIIGLIIYIPKFF